MRTIQTTLLSLLVGVTLTACGGNSERAQARAERMKPATSVSTMTVSMTQPPGAMVNIGPDGTLRIDDVVLPQPPQKQAELQNYFGQLQMRRQQMLDKLQSNGYKPITIAPDDQLKPFQEKLMADFPELRPYKASLGTIRLEVR